MFHVNAIIFQHTRDAMTSGRQLRALWILLQPPRPPKTGVPIVAPLVSPPILETTLPA